MLKDRIKNNCDPNSLMISPKERESLYRDSIKLIFGNIVSRDIMRFEPYGNNLCKQVNRILFAVVFMIFGLFNPSYAVFGLVSSIAIIAVFSFLEERIGMTGATCLSVLAALIITSFLMDLYIKVCSKSAGMRVLYIIGLIIDSVFAYYIYLNHAMDSKKFRKSK